MSYFFDFIVTLGDFSFLLRLTGVIAAAATSPSESSHSQSLLSMRATPSVLHTRLHMTDSTRVALASKSRGCRRSR